MKFEKLDDMIILKIRNSPGAKFADIYDDEVKEECKKLSHRPPLDGFRVADRRLQALRRGGVIEYRRGGWFLK